jgi:uncharacterized protein (TIGR02300 family)
LRAAFDSAAALWQGAARLPGTFPALSILKKVIWLMVKPEWGTKRTCPKCATRFYDLGKEDPVSCISCGNAWAPEPVLKSKQPMPFDAPTKEADPEKEADSDLATDLDLDVDEDAEVSPDDEVDLGGDDDLGVDTGEVEQDN